MRGSRVAILGVSYKSGVGDLRESPALKIMKHPPGPGRRPPLPRRLTCPTFPSSACVPRRSDDALDGCDVAVIVTAHPGLDLDLLAERAPLVVDFRGVTAKVGARNVVRL